MTDTWTEKDNALVKTFVFPTFEKAIAWMNEASKVISKLNHHPEWTNIYNRVIVKLTTHDCGNTITDKDRELAEALDQI